MVRSQIDPPSATTQAGQPRVCRVTNMLHWYLVHTKASNETVAETNLARQGYEVYLPRLIHAARRCGERRSRIVALFPRYLFLRLNEGQQALNPVLFTTGVSRVIRFGADYTIVPDQVIRDLRERADPHTGLHRLTREAHLRPGARVRIEMGPFDGLDGVFEREAGGERVVVLLKLLGQNTSACLPRDLVVPGHAY